MAIFLYQNDLPSDLDLDGDIAIDTETMGLVVNRDRLCLLQLSNGNGDAHLVNFTENYDAPNLKRLLTDEDRCKIFHFARFDLAAIKHYLNITIKNVYCTKIASRLARTYSDSHGLRDLCRELLSVQISKQQQSSDWGETKLIKEQLEYAANDVTYLHMLRTKLNNLLVREGRMKLAEECFKFLPARIDLDLGGWQDLDIFAH